MTEKFTIPPGSRLLIPFYLDTLTWGELRRIVSLADGLHDDNDAVSFTYYEGTTDISDIEIWG